MNTVVVLLAIFIVLHSFWYYFRPGDDRRTAIPVINSLIIVGLLILHFVT